MQSASKRGPEFEVEIGELLRVGGFDVTMNAVAALPDPAVWDLGSYPQQARHWQAVQAATTEIRATALDRGFLRITISTS